MEGRWSIRLSIARTRMTWTGHRRIFLIDRVWCITSLWTCGWHTFTCHQCILLFVLINSLIYWFSLLLASRRSSRLLNNNNTYHDWRSRINYSVQGPWLDLFYGPKCPFLSASPVFLSSTSRRYRLIPKCGIAGVAQNNIWQKCYWFAWQAFIRYDLHGVKGRP